tara:strand:+ start:2742 stop:3758 length:1017 start_codon:yes stop_codon:yes gene_type:complete
LKLSIIIPVYNEINFLEKFTKDLKNAFHDQKEIEFIFINDGSSDGSNEWLDKYKQENKIIFIDLKNNHGKGYAIRKGLEVASGDYVLFQDSDLELNPSDSREMYELIKRDSELKVLFGSRFLSGKLRANRYFINEIFVKLNSIIFNILFRQSVTDLHCGTKIISREVIEKIKLSINDFGFEIDIASQIAKNNFQIYEYGVSYFSRSKLEGKKITWIDGILSYYYFFKTRFINNDISTLLSIIYSSFYMGFVGSYFGMSLGKSIVIIIFSFYGAFIGLYRKLFTSSLVFLFIYFGSLFSKGNGKIYTVLIAFIIGMYLSKLISSKIKNITKNKIINFFV